jgi:chromosome partitioning protein
MTTSTIALANLKGGTGKTTTTINLGASLVELGYKVLLIDLDPLSSLTYSLGIPEQRYYSGDLFFKQVPITSAMVEQDGLFIVPAREELAKTGLALAKDPSAEYLLRKQIKRLEGFDFVLIDVGPALGPLMTNSLTAADKLIVPVQLDVLSMQGLSKIMNQVFMVKEEYNSDLSILGVLPVMVDSRKKITKEIHDFLKEHFGLRVFNSWIKADARVTEAPSYGKSVISFAPESRGTQCYRDFCKEFLSLTRPFNNRLSSKRVLGDHLGNTVYANA